MSASPRASVICTVRNGERTLPSVLDSIRSQSLTDWEFIAVDDGSTDGTFRLIEEFAAKDPRVRPIPTRGIGRGRALNVALQHARAPIVLNVDGDDPSHPRRLEACLDALARHAEFDVVGTATVLLAAHEKPRWEALGDGASPAAVRDVTRLLAYYNPVNHSSMCARRDALLAVGGYDAERRTQFDYDLWVRLAAAGRRLGLLPLQLASKRVHAAQSFENRRRLRYVLASAAVQARSIRAQKAPPTAWIVLGARVSWGLVPAQVRTPLRPAVWRLLHARRPA